MTRVKICGLTSVRDALAAVEAGADALGFVFAASPRRVEPQEAREIVRRLPPFVRTVGVFRDASYEEIRRGIDESGVDVIQLHGEESPQLCARLYRPVLKRLPIGEPGDNLDLRRRVASYTVAALLLDPGAGSGRTFPWEMARGLPGKIIVAGGLNSENVVAAVRAARPYAVDVASGVEARPGVKDHDKIRALIGSVRREDERIVSR